MKKICLLIISAYLGLNGFTNLYSQSLQYEVYLGLNATKLVDLNYTKGDLFIAERASSQILPGAQVNISVLKNAIDNFRFGIKLRGSYKSHFTYIPIYYPQDGIDFTTSKYGATSQEIGLTLFGFGKLNFNNLFSELGLGYHNSISRKNNSLIKKGYDGSREDRPDGDNNVLNGPQMDLALGFNPRKQIKGFTFLVGLNLAMFNEKYVDPSTNNTWTGKPLTLYTAIGYQW